MGHKTWVIQNKKTRTVYGGTNKEFKSFMSNICNQAKRRVDETSRSRASSISGDYIMVILGNVYDRTYDLMANSKLAFSGYSLPGRIHQCHNCLDDPNASFNPPG